MTTGDVVYSLRFFTHQSAEPGPGFELRSTAGESRMLTARLHMLYFCTTGAITDGARYYELIMTFRNQLSYKISLFKVKE